VSATKKSLREIANAQSLSGGRGFKKCLCKSAKFIKYLNVNVNLVGYFSIPNATII